MNLQQASQSLVPAFSLLASPQLLAADGGGPQTVLEGLRQGTLEPVLGMQHLAFCLMAGLMLFTFRKKPWDMFYYLLALIPGLLIERYQTLPLLPVNLVVALTVTLVLFQQWIYEKMAAITIPLLLGAGLFHGVSLAKASAGSSPQAFAAYAVAAILVQGLVVYNFGAFCRRMSVTSPTGFAGLENILSAVGTGVALAYFFFAF